MSVRLVTVKLTAIQIAHLLDGLALVQAREQASRRLVGSKDARGRSLARAAAKRALERAQADLAGRLV